jgi:hypothetical protein
MQNPFQGQERLFEEQRKIQEVVSMPVPEHTLAYMREHPAFKTYMYPNRYFDNQKNHAAFSDTEFLNGKVVYNVM